MSLPKIWQSFCSQVSHNNVIPTKYANTLASKWSWTLLCLGQWSWECNECWGDVQQIQFFALMFNRYDSLTLEKSDFPEYTAPVSLECGELCGEICDEIEISKCLWPTCLLNRSQQAGPSSSSSSSIILVIITWRSQSKSQSSFTRYLFATCSVFYTCGNSRQVPQLTWISAVGSLQKHMGWGLFQQSHLFSRRIHIANMPLLV